MDQQNNRPPALFDLIGRNWSLETAITSVTFNHDVSAACLAMDDGRLALIDLADEEPPHSRIRIGGDDGRATISPRQKQVADAHILPALSQSPCLIAPYKNTDFIVGAQDGKIHIVSPSKEVALLNDQLTAPIVGLDHNQQTALTAFVSSKELCVLKEGEPPKVHTTSMETPNTTLALSPDGDLLATGDQKGLLIWSLEDLNTPIKRIELQAPPHSIAWKQDQNWIVCALHEKGCQLIDLTTDQSAHMQDYPGPVTTACWSAPANAFATSGAFRIAAWTMQTPPLENEQQGALQTGRPGMVLVTSIATNPKTDFVAAGFENGQLVLTKVGVSDELPIVNEGSPITNLAWSKDGKQLAFGCKDGTAAIIDFPPQMFR